MGYTTDFEGHVDITPPLSAKEVEYINRFNETRRMDRENGPYFVGGSDDFGQGRDSDIYDHNRPPAEQPGLWCQWRASEDGTRIEWDGGEKFYNAPEWMQYIIDHFIGDDPIAKRVNSHFDFLEGHSVNGVIRAYGEDPEDLWTLTVADNVVVTKDAEINW